MINQKELQENIKKSKKLLDMFKDKWNTIPEDRRAATYYTLGAECKRIAIAQLLLKNKKESMNWFKKAAEYFMKSEVMKEEKPILYLEILNTAIISKDQKLITKAKEFVSDISAEFPENHKNWAYLYYYLILLLDILNKKDIQIAKTIAKLKELEEKTRIERAHKGMAKTAEGILTKNEAVFTEGINKILRSHKKTKPFSKTNSDDAICLTATILLILAKQRKIQVKKEKLTEDKQYIANSMLENE
ncbi:hypothetical protein GF343_03115 [Candidatus Woesearchaeota archaeon]|nr:hypothetical protein [Candidatus Woesearchaeota archaeon]